MTSKKCRILAFGMAAVAFLSSLLVLYSSSLKGFPDGHKTELDRAVIPLSQFYAGAGSLFGLLFVLLGWLAPKQNFAKKLWIAVAGFAVLAIVVLAVYYDLSLRLDDGAGG